MFSVNKKKKTNAERQREYRQSKKEKEKMYISTNASNSEYQQWYVFNNIYNIIIYYNYIPSCISAMNRKSTEQNACAMSLFTLCLLKFLPY